MLDEATTVTIAPQGRQRLPRTATDMKGVVNLYVDDGKTKKKNILISSSSNY